MEFSYETQGTKTFLVYTVPENEQLDMMSVGMLVNNRIPGFAQTIFTQMNNTRCLKYNISAMVQASQLFMSPISRKRFLGVLNGIGCAMLSAEEYMLDPGTILLDLAYMYADVRTDETVLICVPVEGHGNGPVDLKDHIKRLMYDTSFDQSENCDYVTKIISFLNQASAFSLPDFLDFLHRLGHSDGQHPQPVEAQTVQTEKPIRQRAAQILAPAQPYPYAPVPQPYTPPQPYASSPLAQTPVAPVKRNAGPICPPADLPQAEKVQANGGDGKQISLMYLLRHYNKENAEAYKAQKGKKLKEEKTAPAERKSKTKGKDAAPAEFATPAGIAVPGMGTQPSAPMLVSAPAPQAPVRVPESQIPPVCPPQSAYPLSIQAAAQTTPGANFGETSFYSDADTDSETMVLGMQSSGQQQLTPHLVRRKNNERIPLDKPVFRLGRDNEFNDYAILDNRYVGHSHCHLLQQDGEFFVVDDNSKNHTLVNGRQITPGQPVKIAHGYVISVADEEFEFKLY